MKIRILAILLALLLISTSCSPDSWKKVKEFKPDFLVTASEFVNTQFGLTIGLYGKIYHTSDGGMTWIESQKVPAECRFDIQVFDEKTALTAGNSGLIITRDGGLTWEKISEHTGRLLSFTDQNTGIFDTLLGKLLFTKDAGKTIEEINTPVPVKKISAVEFFAKDKLFIIDEKGNLYKSQDQGKSWNNLNLAYKYNDLLFIKGMTIIKFKNSNEGTIITRYNGDKDAWLIMNTRDGGKSWSSKMLKEKSGIINLSQNLKFLTIYTLSTPGKLLVYENK